MTVLGLILLAIAVASLLVDRAADLRAASMEAKYPPEGEIVNVDGVDIHVRVVGTGTDLVLIHGAGGSSREFNQLADQLKDRFRIFLVDRPGLGWSEHARQAYKSSWSRQAESPQEQAAILSQAVTALGASNPLVLGHSYGGAVAMAWALSQPASGIVIVSGATMPWSGKLNVTYRILGSRLGGLLVAPLVAVFITNDYLRQTVDGIFAPQPMPEGYIGQNGVVLALRTETLRANNRQVNTLRPHIVRMAEQYPDLTHPVEILHGDADVITPMQTHAIPLSETLPNGNLTVLDGIGHMPHYVAQDQVIAAIDRVAARAELGATE